MLTVKTRLIPSKLPKEFGTSEEKSTLKCMAGWRQFGYICTPSSGTSPYGVTCSSAEASVMYWSNAFAFFMLASKPNTNWLISH